MQGCKGARVLGVIVALRHRIMAKDFTELAAWQLADQLRLLILEITSNPSVARDFKYCNQCKDAARSAASNITEGFGRYRHRDFARFLRYALGSLAETRHLLMEGRDKRYLAEPIASRLLNLSAAVDRATKNLMLSRLRQAKQLRDTRAEALQRSRLTTDD